MTGVLRIVAVVLLLLAITGTVLPHLQQAAQEPVVERVHQDQIATIQPAIQPVQPAPPRLGTSPSVLVQTIHERVAPSHSDLPSPVSVSQSAATWDNANERARIIARIEATWRDWLTKEGIPGAAIAIGHHGQLVHEAGQGRTPDARVNLASLSKSITAVCVQETFHARGLNLKTTLGDLSDVLGTARATPPAHSHEITIAELLTHTSGLKPDITQSNEEFSRARFANEPLDTSYSLKALARRAVTGTRGEYFYNNGNYAVLGAVLRGLYGGNYEAACRELVLRPANADAISFSGKWGGLGGFAGWNGSAADYLHFANYAFAADMPRRQEPGQFPYAQTGYRWQYGLGMGYTPVDEQFFISHYGRICVAGSDDNITTFYFSNVQGWSVSVNLDGCVTREKRASLQRKLNKVAR